MDRKVVQRMVTDVRWVKEHRDGQIVVCVVDPTITTLKLSTSGREPDIAANRAQFHITIDPFASYYCTFTCPCPVMHSACILVPVLGSPAHPCPDKSISRGSHRVRHVRPKPFSWIWNWISLAREVELYSSCHWHNTASSPQRARARAIRFHVSSTRYILHLSFSLNFSFSLCFRCFRRMASVYGK